MDRRVFRYLPLLFLGVLGCTSVQYTRMLYKGLVLEQPKGYAEAIEKSTSWGLSSKADMSRVS
jgi:hypothetical protein